MKIHFDGITPNMHYAQTNFVFIGMGKLALSGAITPKMSNALSGKPIEKKKCTKRR